MAITKEKALRSKIGFPVSTDAIETALAESNINGTATYSKEDKREIELCAAGLILSLYTYPDVAEGDFSRKMPSKDKLQEAYTIIVNRWGEPNLILGEGPTITGISPW